MKKRVWISLLVLGGLLITYFIGPVPETPTYTKAWPEVPAALPALEKWVRERERTLRVREDNQARILWQDETPRITEYAFVYLHGLKPPASLDAFSAESAWQSAKEALAIGRRIGRKVIILSTSTGGTLALKLAATYSDSVFALINISPNIKDDHRAAFLLNSPWGQEIAHLVSLGANRRIGHETEIAAQYWDTIYPAEALNDLQVLLNSTMKPSTYRQIQVPVLTVYYHKNFLQEDERVEVSVYLKVHQLLGTPDLLKVLLPLEGPGTHFIGSAIKSEDYRTAQNRIIAFCRDTLGMVLPATRRQANS